MTVDAPTLSLLLGALIPLAVAALAKIRASNTVKVMLNAGLSALAGVLALVVPGSPLDLRSLAVSITVAWVASLLTYVGVYKPAGIASAVQWRTKSFGID